MLSLNAKPPTTTAVPCEVATRYSSLNSDTNCSASSTYETLSQNSRGLCSINAVVNEASGMEQPSEQAFQPASRSTSSTIALGNVPTGFAGLSLSPSLLAGLIAAYLLHWGWGLAQPSPAELTGALLLVAAIVLLAVAPKLSRRP